MNPTGDCIVCGIAGCIGRSKNLEASYQLLTRLFVNCESRGKDAAGFWGTEQDLDGRILVHKEGIESSKFVRKPMWKKTSGQDINMMLLHARASSSGVGSAFTNFNNHPFVNSSKTIALTHNGRVQQYDYDVLSKQYETRTKCDSEILLRMFEGGELANSKDLQESFPEMDTELARRLAGIKEIWRLASKAHMAVAFGERKPDGERRLWLFRNTHRPLWLIDMREELGQIFYASTPEIWQKSLAESPHAHRHHGKRVKMVELPTEQVWYFNVTPDSPVVQDGQLLKFKVEKSGSYDPWEPDDKNVVNIPKKRLETEVVTQLKEGDDSVVRDAIMFCRPKKENDVTSKGETDDALTDELENVTKDDPDDDTVIIEKEEFTKAVSGSSSKTTSQSNVGSNSSATSAAGGNNDTKKVRGGGHQDNRPFATGLSSTTGPGSDDADEYALADDDDGDGDGDGDDDGVVIGGSDIMLEDPETIITDKLDKIRTHLDDLEVLATQFGLAQVSFDDLCNIAQTLETIESDLSGTLFVANG